jgi:hypothetical protein
MTKITSDLYPLKRAKRYNLDRDRFLTENRSVSTAILAMDMGVTERFVIQYLRKLGLRPFTSHGKRIER